MVKNIQLKIMVILLITGAIIISGLGIFYSIYLNELNTQIIQQTLDETSINQAFIQSQEQIKMLTIYTIIAFIIITFIASFFLSKLMISSMTKQMNKIKKLDKGEDINMKAVLLHMTDGIIAFNREGRILLINPAATRLLRIIPEDDSFEKIFSKLNIDISIEKIIYLENWTSFEQTARVRGQFFKVVFCTNRKRTGKTNWCNCGCTRYYRAC